MCSTSLPELVARSKRLRCGATVLATTRFPVDAARRYAALPDFGVWRAEFASARQAPKRMIARKAKSVETDRRMAFKKKLLLMKRPTKKSHVVPGKAYGVSIEGRKMK